MEKYNFSIDLDIPVLNLSAGQKQKVEIIRCLIRSPEVLIMDEPTSSLSQKETEKWLVQNEAEEFDGAFWHFFKIYSKNGHPDPQTRFFPDFPGFSILSSLGIVRLSVWECGLHAPRFHALAFLARWSLAWSAVFIGSLVSGMISVSFWSVPVQVLRMRVTVLRCEAPAMSA